MLLRNALLAGLAAGALAAPVAASAQSWWGGGDYNRGWNYGDRQSFRGYPQFQGIKSHIRQEIRQGLDDGWLDEDQAQNLYQNLRAEQWDEAREFRYHGWNLPYDDQARLNGRLSQIDRSVDQARDEGGGQE